eukprot:GHVU01203470.1.p1 GENE.GHVU01203470.1~~GHVU01203470.1.p1  ORF type:complete len:935 (+),score=64.52 GHVU01203470.1:99-2903(+)
MMSDDWDSHSSASETESTRPCHLSSAAIRNAVTDDDSLVPDNIGITAALQGFGSLFWPSRTDAEDFLNTFMETHNSGLCKHKPHGPRDPLHEQGHRYKCKVGGQGSCAFAVVIEWSQTLATSNEVRRTGEITASASSSSRIQPQGSPIAACTTSASVSTTTGGQWRIRWNGSFHNHPLRSIVRHNAFRRSRVVDQYNELRSVYQLSNHAAATRTNVSLDEGGHVGVSNSSLYAMAGRDRHGHRRHEQQQHIEACPGIMAVDVGGGPEGPVYRSSPTSTFDDTTKSLIGCLRLVQQKNKHHYIRILAQRDRITYVFIALSHMRTQGCLFGDLRTVDDKHQVSACHCRMGVWSVVSNKRESLPVAVAWFAHGNTDAWKQFIQDAHAAFGCTQREGRPYRTWEATIADMAPEIHKAIREDPLSSPLAFYCWFHVGTRMDTKHNDVRDVWDQMKPLLQELLYSDKHWCYDDFISGLWQLIPQIRSHKAQDKLRDSLRVVCKQVVDLRLPAKVKCFTNSYTSQSTAECQFARLNLNVINNKQPLWNVVQKVCTDLMSSQVTTSGRARLPAAVQGQLLTTYQHITDEAYTDIFNPQFYDAGNYDYEATRSPDRFLVRRRGTAISPHAVRVVQVIRSEGDVAYECCCNFQVRMGVVCRHIIRVMGVVEDGGNYVFRESHVNSRWARTQPVVTLSEPSPFLAPPATAALPVDTTTSSAAGVNTTSEADGGHGHAAAPLYAVQREAPRQPQTVAQMKLHIASSVTTLLTTMGDNGALHRAFIDNLDAFQATVTAASGRGGMGMDVALPARGRGRSRRLGPGRGQHGSKRARVLVRTREGGEGLVEATSEGDALDDAQDGGLTDGGQRRTQIPVVSTDSSAAVVSAQIPPPPSATLTHAALDGGAAAPITGAPFDDGAVFDDQESTPSEIDVRVCVSVHVCACA